MNVLIRFITLQNFITFLQTSKCSQYSNLHHYCLTITGISNIWFPISLRMKVGQQCKSE